jgi:hypothetical protein
MSLLKKHPLVVTAFSIIGFFYCSNLLAANIYVDNRLSANITDASYSITNRDNSGSDGKAYKTVQAAVNAMNAGDHIILRGGTYQECVHIPESKNGSSWDEGSYNKIESCNTETGCFPNEWAVLDGNQSCDSNGGAVLGNVSSTESGSSDIKYWWIERLEIKNGRNFETAYGFNGNGGPFKFRYNYVHDNIAVNCNNLPSGVWGQQWHDSVIEYNWFADNGGTLQHNCKQVGWISAYSNSDSIAENMDFGSAVVDKSNNIQYNLVEGGNVGIGVKHFTLFTGRTVSSPYSDKYKDYGTKIHHNIIRNSNGYAIGAHGDFWQVYNNIIDSPRESGIVMQYDYVDYAPLYKTTVYNNTILNPGYSAIIGLGKRWKSVYNTADYKYIYNNIVDGAATQNQWCKEAPITAQLYCDGDLAIDFQHHVISHNYTYRPKTANQYKVALTYYTPDGFEKQSITTAPKIAYNNNYDAGNLLYKAESGTDGYVTDGSHVIEAGVTIANGGIGGMHPYLNINLPSYVGATNPVQHNWVSGVLSFKNKVNNIPITLRDAISGEDAWQMARPKPPEVALPQ